MRTPQYLDTYCRIYQNRKIIANYSTSQGLYEELWKILILHPKSANINALTLEKFLYKIAQKIQQYETLTPTWIETGNDTQLIGYLSSEGIVTYEHNRIRFFHQSFYDYVFARQIIAGNDSLYDLITRNHQGLFIRSTIKQVLTYLRDYDSARYYKELEQFLFASNIRLHLKLLILQNLAAVEHPSSQEQLIVKQLNDKDRLLYNTFLKQSISNGWFEVLVPELKNILINADNKDDEHQWVVMNFFIRFSNQKSDIVFDLINVIHNLEIRSFVAERSLWGISNHTNPKIVTWYHLLNETSRTWNYNFLKGAILDNPLLVCQELPKIVEKSIPIWLNESRRQEEWKQHRLFDDILEPMVKQYPMMIYPIIRNTILTLINKTKFQEGSSYLDSNTAFNNRMSENKSYRKFIKWIVDILHNQIENDISFVIDEIRQYISYKDNTSYRIALEVMLHSPQHYTDIVLDFFKNHALVEDLLDHGDNAYYFRELLKVIYPFFTAEQKDWIQLYALRFESSHDKIPNRGERNWSRLKYPYLGIMQRDLIYSLPQDVLCPKLRRKRDELDRRFRWKCTNEPPHEGVGVAHLCGGLVSSDIYKKFSLKNWEASFLKCKDYHFRKGEPTHFDIRIHIQEFKNCVKDNPVKFYPFIQKIVKNELIDYDIKIAGLRGLIESEFSFPELYEWWSQIIKLTDKGLQNDIIEIAGLMLKQNSEYSNHIIDYLFSIIQSEYVSHYSPEIESKTEDNERISKLLSHGVNSIQGSAILALVEACAFKERRDGIYKKLTILSNILNIEHKLTVLYQLYYRELFAQELFGQLLDSYLNGFVTSEYIFALVNIINHYLSCEPNIVLPYLRSVLDLPRAQKNLAKLLYLGSCYDNKECQILLDRKLQYADNKFYFGLLEIAFDNFSDPLCHDLSLKVLDQISQTSNDEVIEKLIKQFHKLNPDDFTHIKPVIDQIIPKVTKGKVAGMLDFLEKCCIAYPIKCYEYLDILIRIESRQGDSIEFENALELLFVIYKRIKSDEKQSEIAERIMDTFDYVLRTKESVHGLAKLLKEVDRMA